MKKLIFWYYQEVYFAKKIIRAVNLLFVTPTYTFTTLQQQIAPRIFYTEKKTVSNIFHDVRYLSNQNWDRFLIRKWARKKNYLNQGWIN